MKVHKIYTESSLKNYNYLVEESHEEVISVDPLFPEQISYWLEFNQKKLSKIVITHNHPDHVAGANELKTKYGCEIWAHSLFSNKDIKVDRVLNDLDILKTLDGEIEFWHTPGHTPDHICLLMKKDGKQHSFISMDTVFNAGVGHCKLGGDPEVLFETICMLVAKLDDSVIIYPGHDYIENNLKFTIANDPENKDAKDLLIQVNQLSSTRCLTTVSLEKKVNLFFKACHIENKSKDKFIELRKKRDIW